MGKFLEDIKDNFKERVTNPFILSFIFAWLIRNWKLIYTIFNFDSKDNREFKLYVINDYFLEAGYKELLGMPLWFAFCGIVVFYFFHNFSRLFARLSSEYVTPFVDWLVKGSSIATRESLNLEKDKNKKLLKQNEELEKGIIDAKDERKKANENYQGHKIELEKVSAELDGSKLKFSALAYELQALKLQSEELNVLKLESEFFDSYFTGTWIIDYPEKQTVSVLTEKFTFEGKYVYVDDEQAYKYSVFSFTYNKREENAKLVLINGSADEVRYFELDIKDAERCSGIENNLRIVYFRKDKNIIVRDQDVVKKGYKVLNLENGIANMKLEPETRTIKPNLKTEFPPKGIIPTLEKLGKDLSKAIAMGDKENDLARKIEDAVKENRSKKDKGEDPTIPEN